MDEMDKLLKDAFSGMDDSSVPFGFAEKIGKKIDAAAVKKADREELARNIMLAILFALLFMTALFFLNKYFFGIDSVKISGIIPEMPDFGGKMKTLFGSGDSVLWIVIGMNVALLLLAERILARKLSAREKERSDI